MKKIKPAAVILAFVSILLGLIMLLPVVWSLFCSLQHETSGFPEVSVTKKRSDSINCLPCFALRTVKSPFDSSTASSLL